MQHNLGVAKKAAPKSKVWAVVKANAYGHGLIRGMHAFAEADGFALIEPEAALCLREKGCRKPILLLEGFFDPKDLDIVASQQLHTTVHCVEQIEMLEQANITLPIDVHLKMNSGMNRLGFPPKSYHAAYHRLRAIKAVRNIVLMTHFANADDATNTALPLEEQVGRFRMATEGLPGERSICNSAATLMHSHLAGDWIRPGIMLYGATPGGGTAESFGLRPAMALASEIIGVQEVVPSDAIGYGSRFVAGKPMRVGVVACGYADGYPRHAPNGTPVIVDGIKTGIVGRVSMDMMNVDLTNIPHAGVGSKVLLWGDQLPIDEVAESAGTIGYELMCALAPRVRIVER